MSENRYCLYIDESGVPELSDNSKFCLFTGVLIPEEDEEGFRFLIQNIKNKFKIDLNKNIHAVDIFERINKKCYLGITARRSKKDLRKEFQKTVWDLIKEYNLQYFTVIVPKNCVRNTLGLNKRDDGGTIWIKSPNYYARADRQLPLDVGANALYQWALKKLKREAKLRIIFESRSGDQFTIRNLNYVQSENVFQNRLMRGFANQIKERVVSVSFANKNIASVGLELTDLICYTCNVYLLQINKKLNKVDPKLKKSIIFPGIHKTLNSKHSLELNDRSVKKFTPGLNSRTKRITDKYKRSRNSLSPAKAEAQLN